MALLPAFAVDGGRGPASMFRGMLWASTSGATGVVQAGDLRVTPLSTPGTAVNVGPGGALAASRYTGASRAETYGVVNDATIPVAIPPTSSGAGRTDYIILKVDDWHFSGSPQPDDPLGAAYCSFERVTSLTGINYPYVPLAKITIPASTGTITSSMITDLREVALPRTQRVLRPNALIWSEEETLTSKTGEYFPNAGGAQTVPIPSWATRVKIRADWFMVRVPKGAVDGRIWVGFGDWNGTRWGAPDTQSQEFAFNNADTGGDCRQSWAVVDDLYIPANLRGRDVHFQMWGKVFSTVRPVIDGISGSSLDLLFEEVADPSDS